MCNKLCVEALAILKVSRLHAGADEKLACWTEGFSTADLDFDNFRVSLMGSLVFCIPISRLNLFCSNHLQGRHYFRGRQTVESHLIHTGIVSTYNVMTSSIHLGSFFCGLYFRGSRFVYENCENLHPVKISCYTVSPSCLLLLLMWSAGMCVSCAQNWTPLFPNQSE